MKIAVIQLTFMRFFSHGLPEDPGLFISRIFTFEGAAVSKWKAPEI